MFIEVFNVNQKNKLNMECSAYEKKTRISLETTYLYRITIQYHVFPLVHC